MLLLTEDDARQFLRHRSEDKHVDFKETASWEKKEKDGKIALVKDILAMANTQDGGKIVIGVKDGSFELIGLPEDQFASFDQTSVNDFLHKYTDPKHSCQVHKFTLDGKRVVIIDVPEYMTDPIICRADAQSSDSRKQVLRAGTIYIRTDKGTSEAIPGYQEMREFLGRAIRKKSAELLSSIHTLISGSVKNVVDTSQEKYAQEQRITDEFFQETLGEYLSKMGFWEVSARPADYVPDRVSDQISVGQLIQNATVSIQRWNFPHTDQENSSNFLAGRRSFTIRQRYLGGYHAFQSGHFIWRRVFWEDIERPDPIINISGPILAFVGVVYSVSEFFTFFERFYSALAPESNINYRIALHGVQGRSLVSIHPTVHLYEPYRATEKIIELTGSASVAELQASYKEIANRLVRKIFILFNWNSVHENLITDLQTRFFNRRF